MVGASTELLRDMLLAAVSAGLGAILGSLLAARMYEKKVAYLEGKVAEQETRLNTLMESLSRMTASPNADGSP